MTTFRGRARVQHFESCIVVHKTVKEQAIN
jgi:hypothetical protein